MRVTVETATSREEYTLYIGADGVWTMHQWDPLAAEGEQWIGTVIGVSDRDPFRPASRVEYNAWR